MNPVCALIIATSAIWKKFYEENRRVPSMGSKEKTEVKLARWQIKTRMDYHKKEKRLTVEKIEMLNRLEGWIWNVR